MDIHITDLLLIICSWASLVFMIIILIVSFADDFGFNNQVEHPWAIRLGMLIIILGTIQGIS